ncbi:hypothetical protein SAMN04487948_102501 [Halogranum amylolyticum]|uniref:DUF7344 domain-containing protein n=1 Tax=Halogranum amylolyticum TaxID=660520 RepID=A0A1H8PV29_9EURY|nr:hypothetical protein [Halogranum amylolyticum]SEO45608.1 hypothetical protein SAMN04487948_102501 [Halogranum amylolyticum]
MSVEDRGSTFTIATTDDDLDADIPAETASDVFANARRRAVLTCLRDRDSTMEIDELAEAVAAEEFGTSREEVPEDRFERVLVSLHHTHLPKLADASIVSITQTNGVHVTGNAAAFEVLA